jgi:putative heme-binding domain-containing protein
MCHVLVAVAAWFKFLTEDGQQKRRIRTFQARCAFLPLLGERAGVRAVQQLFLSASPAAAFFIVLLFARSMLAADPADPAIELASFKIAPGFEVNLFASEANGVVKPIQCRWDSRGRLWVIGSTVYPQLEPGQTPNDKVVILEDTDADGRADKTTVFADGLMIPTGLELDGDGLGCWLGEGTQLLHLRDTDGDGHADEKRVVLRGFGTGDNHQNINSFRWTHGGELVFCQGLHAHGRVETPYGIVALDEAGFWRLRPRQLRLDGFYGGPAEPQNPWGFTFTDWGQMLINAGNNGGVSYPLPEMIRGHAIGGRENLWPTARGRKTSGPDFVANSHWPPEWQSVMILGGYINNAVWVLKIDDDGAGFRLTDLPPLITSTDTSFRPVDVKFGPDGALYIADWFNPIIGHYQASFRHPDRDKAHGRIWRVTARGRPLVQPPKFKGLPLAAVLDQLKSSERWNREQARRVLADGDTAAVTNALKSWLLTLDPNDPRHEHHLFEALGIFETHEVVEPNLLKRLLAAQEPNARAYAAGVVGRWADHLPQSFDLLAPLVHDPHPRVRLAAVVATANIPGVASLDLALQALDHPTDKFIDVALRQTVFALKPRWLPVLQSGQLELLRFPARLSFLVKADATPDVLNSVVGLLAGDKIRWDSGRAGLLQALPDIGGPKELARLLERQTFIEQERQKDIYHHADHARTLAALASASRFRNVRPAGDVARSLAELAVQTAAEEDVRAEAYRLIGLWKLTRAQPMILLEATGASNESAARLAAIESLGALGGEEAQVALKNLAPPSQPPRVRLTAISGLSVLDLPAAAALAAEAIARDRDESLATQLVSTFLQRRGGPDALARALADRPPRRDAARLALRHMQSIGRQDQALITAFTSAAALGGEPLHASADFVTQLSKEIHDQGDSRRGAEIFRRADLSCLSCHSVAGQGGTIGPALDAIGSGQPLDFIIGAVLEPNKEVKESFEAIEVTTKDGDVHTGYRLRADARELVMRDVTLNKEVRLRRDQIAEQRDRGSLMPAGLLDHLTRAELRDLFRYLSELGKPAR